MPAASLAVDVVTVVVAASSVVEVVVAAVVLVVVVVDAVAVVVVVEVSAGVVVVVLCVIMEEPETSCGIDASGTDGTCPQAVSKTTQKNRQTICTVIRFIVAHLT